MRQTVEKIVKECFICDENSDFKHIINGIDEDNRHYIFEKRDGFICANRINSNAGDPYFDGEFVAYSTMEDMLISIEEKPNTASPSP